MHWYNLIKKLSQTYFDIGFSHQHNKTMAEPQLWAMIGDKIDVANVGDNDTHGIAGMLQDSDNLPEFYRGRFEENTKGKFVSVIKPRGLQSFHALPTRLISLLEEKFGKDIQIIKMGSNEII